MLSRRITHPINRLLSYEIKNWTRSTFVAIVHMGLYTSDSGWGRGLNIVHETVRRRWFGVSRLSRESPWEIAALTGAGLLW